MNVLQVTPSVIHPPKHGSEQRPHGLVSAFPSISGEVVRFCQRTRGYPSLRPGVNEVQISDGYIESRYSNPLDELMKVTSRFGYPSFVFLGTMLRWSRPRRLLELADWADVILVEEYWQVAAMDDLTNGVPIIYSTQNVGIEYLQSDRSKPLDGWFYARAARLEREAVRRADMIVCEHDADKNEIKDAYDPAGPIIAIPNAVYASEVRDSSQTSDAGLRVRERHSIPKDALVGIFVGSNTDFNIDAARALPAVAERVAEQGYDFYVMVVGKVGTSIDEKPDNVITPGYVDDLEAYYDAADIGLNSLTWGTTPTGSNIKMIEYLSRGLPIVSTEYGASGYDVTPGENLLVRDLDEFHEGIIRLGDDEEFRRELGQRALAYVRENHTWEGVSSQLYREIEERLLNRSSRSVAGG